MTEVVLGDIGKVSVLNIKKYTDDRGFIDQLHNDDYPFNIKRIYRIKPFKGIVRGFHGHKKEWKAFLVLDGTVKFITYPVEGKETTVTVLRADDKVLIVPPGFYNGFVALTDDVDMIGLSSSTLKESQNDDYREDPYIFGKNIWRTEDR